MFVLKLSGYKIIFIQVAFWLVIVSFVSSALIFYNTLFRYGAYVYYNMILYKLNDVL